MKRLHPLSAVRQAVGGVIQGGFLGFFAGVFLRGVLEGPALPFQLLLAPLGAALGAGYAVAEYYRFTYELRDGTLAVASGVFDRQDREIPVGRIQNVDLERGVVHRALGLAVVRFETAGGSATEAVLDAVALDEARDLQETVAAQRRAERDREATGASEGAATGASERAATDVSEEDATDAGESGIATGTREDDAADDGADAGPGGARGATAPSSTDRIELYELSRRDLVVLGLASFRPGAPVLTVLGLPFLGDLAWGAVAAGSRLLGGPAVGSIAEVVALPPERFALVAGVALVEFAVATLLLSAVVTMVAYYDFRLYRVGDDLRYERGLLSRYSGSIPLGKVQTVTVRENALLRRWGYAALAVETAGYGPGSDDASNTAIPLDDLETVVEYAEALGDVEYPTVERPPSRARRRYAVRFALVPVALAGALLAVHRFWIAFPWWYVALAGLVLAPVAGHLRWRNRGHALVDGAFLARSGFWVRHTRVVPYFRVQTVVDERTVFQRYRDLASVTADTASTASVVGGDATAYDVDESTAREIHRTLRDRLAADVRRLRAREGGWQPRPLPGEATSESEGEDEDGNESEDGDDDPGSADGDDPTADG